MAAVTSLILRDVRRTESYYFACGGLADLYKGQWTRQPGDILPVAIKLIRRSSWNDKSTAERAQKRFLREAYLWAQLHHPNIVPFYGLIFERDFPGLVMPYYKNGDLIQYLRKHPEAKKLDLICQVAAGLVYLHELKPNSVVHGDIKASNIMVTDAGQACLTDFGVAKMLSVSGYTTTNLGGTCRWMSPELLEEYDPSPTVFSDTWAFGMTILQIFTGKVPFDYLRNDATVIISLAKGTLPEKPEEVNNTIWAMLKRCWAAEPTKRPAVSTLSIVLSIMAHQHLTPEHVNDLVDSLELERPRAKDEETIRTASSSPTAMLVHQPTPEKQGKQPFSSHFHRKLSLDKILTHDSTSPVSFHSLLRRSPDEKHTEPPPLTISSEPHAYRCHWPNCEAHFITLEPWRAHYTDHWLASKSDDDDGTSPMPGISSILT
ncbi:hypothetical protein D9756_005502 [Leucocoprinus leucothites]|uniref:Protein kinase domain-containing protein n=1 Tax=Leucocoprinus leucothites TaxID=201217 RepID=A0A8H5D721_9AGAR|nr:hypothetical protein D9756_005502 [Leucoagaricus leucothites]